MPGVSAGLHLRLTYVLEREVTGYCDHPRLEGGEFSVGHVAEPFRDRIGRKMHELEGPRRTSFHLMAFHRRYDLQKWTRSNR
jgi:hypothetical protein